MNDTSAVIEPHAIMVPVWKREAFYYDFVMKKRMKITIYHDTQAGIVILFLHGSPVTLSFHQIDDFDDKENPLFDFTYFSQITWPENTKWVEWEIAEELIKIGRDFVSNQKRLTAFLQKNSS